MNFPPYLDRLYCSCGAKATRTDPAEADCECDFLCCVCDGPAAARYQGEIVCLPCGERAHQREESGEAGLDPFDFEPGALTRREVETAEETEDIDHEIRRAGFSEAVRAS